MKLRMFTDGACSGNPGPGGWAVLVMYPDGNKVISGGKKHTTNNRMELTAIIEALKIAIDELWALKLDFNCHSDVIEIHSDSTYVVDAIKNKSVKKWDNNGWQTATGEKVKNIDLWIELIRNVETIGELGAAVEFIKVKGHSGNMFNELADQAARDAVAKIKSKSRGIKR